MLQLARWTHKILFYRAAFLNSGKVRELVGEIKYAFGVKYNVFLDSDRQFSTQLLLFRLHADFEEDLKHGHFSLEEGREILF